MVKEISKEILHMPVLNNLLDSELDRVFRSDLFSKRTELDAGQLTLRIFSQTPNGAAAMNFKRKQSIVGRKKSILPDFEATSQAENDWKTNLSPSSLSWLTRKAHQCSEEEDGEEKAVGHGESLESGMLEALLAKRYLSPSLLVISIVSEVKKTGIR